MNQRLKCVARYGTTVENVIQDILQKDDSKLGRDQDVTLIGARV